MKIIFEAIVVVVAIILSIKQKVEIILMVGGDRQVHENTMRRLANNTKLLDQEMLQMYKEERRTSIS